MLFRVIYISPQEKYLTAGQPIHIYGRNILYNTCHKIKSRGHPKKVMKEEITDTMQSSSRDRIL